MNREKEDRYTQQEKLREQLISRRNLTDAQIRSVKRVLFLEEKKVSKNN